MLSRNSPYHEDQLVEKLQLMLATQELEVASWSKNHPTKETWHFVLVTTGQRYRVEVTSNHFKNVDQAIVKLAQMMISTIKRNENLINPAQPESIPTP